eukprot:CAMPEP_0179224598 /NCGR_PEP_ID=MMETSP0797-20121207/7870_1 /TAXON_ID=47934 /ORGANISM="Dinophysis acuminata, Strain DAEP01" /LENGTH=66 /DNA_ID=CAMNT_0020931579 /DNA_START=251 /DNA_END=451 /DNA_ORIENTATION=+
MPARGAPAPPWIRARRPFDAAVGGIQESRRTMCRMIRSLFSGVSFAPLLAFRLPSQLRTSARSCGA